MQGPILDILHILYIVAFNLNPIFPSVTRSLCAKIYTLQLSKNKTKLN